ncbi:MAG: ribonuclease HII [Clostridia bacterium]|nr:ribonuclease HII [Clostridia bacterium]
MAKSKKDEEPIDWLFYERKAADNGYLSVCGVDEAGRGPVAGPVCAAAVILPKGKIIEGVNDSKKISEKKREALYDIITNEAVAYSVAFASVEEIEEINILNAAMLAMKRAVEGLSVPADYVIVDGNKMPDITADGETVIKGDAKSESVAAASILAKVTRDRLMYVYSEKYPQYGFERHKGYGTKEHMAAILEHGMTDIHRPSFLKKLFDKADNDD